MHGGTFGFRFLLGFENPFQEGTELQFFENFTEFALIGAFPLQCVQIQFDGNIGLDSGQKFGEADLFAVGLNLCTDGSLQLVGMFQQVLDAAEFGNQFLSCFFSYSRAPRNVIGRVAHQSQHIDDLQGGCNRELGFHFFYTHNFEFFVTVFGTVHEYTVGNQLAIVFVRCHHIGRYLFLSGQGSQCTDDIVCFVTRYFQNRNIVGADDVLDDRYRQPDDFRCLFPLGFVLFVGLVAEGRSGGVEGDADMRGIFFLQHFFQGIDESQDGRCVETFRIDAGILDKGVVGTINQCIRIQ